MTSTEELRHKTESELERVLKEKRHNLWSFRFGVTGSKVRNVKEGQSLRREIARILTVLNEKKGNTSE